MGDWVGWLLCLVLPVIGAGFALAWLLYGVDEWKRMIRGWLDKK